MNAELAKLGINEEMLNEFTQFVIRKKLDVNTHEKMQNAALLWVKDMEQLYKSFIENSCRLTPVGKRYAEAMFDKF